jgi:hypothetical protein
MEPMIATTLGIWVIVAQTTVGWHGQRDAVATSCNTCSVETSPVLAEIVQLQKSPNWRARERAANALRRVDWRSHPEVPGALAYSLLNDPRREVRQEAAESLARMGACGPVVHEAMFRASNDRDLFTRMAARRGLRKLSRTCTGSCVVCASGPASVVEPGETVVGPTILEPGGTQPARGVVVEEGAVRPPAPPKPIPGSSIDSTVKPPAADEVSPLPAPAGEEKSRQDDGLAPLSGRAGASVRVLPRPVARPGVRRPVRAALADAAQR